VLIWIPIVEPSVSEIVWTISSISIILEVSGLSHHSKIGDVEPLVLRLLEHIELVVISEDKSGPGVLISIITEVDNNTTMSITSLAELEWFHVVTSHEELEVINVGLLSHAIIPELIS
jgi:hypothetical protein